ncbi:MAG: helY [Mycobacterium sp.]|nr:helY [Mycobacterium sp.]
MSASPAPRPDDAADTPDAPDPEASATARGRDRPATGTGEAARRAAANPGGQSPAERYAAFRRAERHSAVTAFADTYPFGLDPFQLEACEALEEGQGVLVAAPTGAGKTVVGEFAAHLALTQGRKCFYTTPIKALSNQKFHDLADRFGAENVGLLTGDVSRNGDAPVVVMTTEVLRNMLYAHSDALAGLGYVVMDEVHYLSDRFRGAVWEEVIIHLPSTVTVVGLSATVSNAEEFAEWLGTVRGDTRTVVHETRPVPLWQHVLLGSTLFDLFTGPARVEVAPGREDELDRVNPELMRRARDGVALPGRGGRVARPQQFSADRPDVIRRLDSAELLPAIFFIFSRAGCEAAVATCLRRGVRLTTPEQATEIRTLVEERTASLPPGDLGVLGYFPWLEGLQRGIAAHHAGLLPAFKEVVEELFARGLIKVVFATETLALGINMPARTVVLEKLSKWNGETHADITPGEYTQLTGRAGRRGIDVEGHAVVLWSPGLDPVALAGLASTRTYPLRSSFRPSYNMAANLVGQLGRDRTRQLLEQSFAQFQADRAVVGLARQVTRNEEAVAALTAQLTCHLGDIESYDRLRRSLKARENLLSREAAASRRAETAAALAGFSAGDVIAVPAGRHSGVAVVLDQRQAARFDGPELTVLTEDRQVRQVAADDLTGTPTSLGRVRIPPRFNRRSAQDRRDLLATLRAKGYVGAGKGRPHRKRSRAADDPQLVRLRKDLRSHPVHGCTDRDSHLRQLERRDAQERETEALRQRVAARTGSITRMFDRVLAVLTELGYLDGDTVTPAGQMLARVYSESDLVVTECIRTGAWEGLDGPELAAVVSALVYEARRPDEPLATQPPATVRHALANVMTTWGRLHEHEARHHLTTLRAPDPGFAAAVYRWAGGGTLTDVLHDVDLTAGDFVRWCKQLVDLLGQIADLAGAAEQAALAAARRPTDLGVTAWDDPALDDTGPAEPPPAARAAGELRRTARAARSAVLRGVVAYSAS